MAAVAAAVAMMTVTKRSLVRAHAHDTDRAGLETIGLVHEHKYATFFTSHVRCQNVPKKRAPKTHMVAPITMAATPADLADGGNFDIAASSTRTPRPPR